MAKHWYLFKDDQHSGPFSVPQLSELIAAGRLKPTDQISMGSGTKPRPISRIAALEKAVSAAASSSTPSDKRSDRPDRPVPQPTVDANLEMPGFFAWLRSDRIARFAWPSVLIGLVVVSISASRWLSQWGDAERTAVTIVRAHQAWGGSDRPRAVELYKLTLTRLGPGKTASIVFRRVVELSVENGEYEYARELLHAALDKSIDMQLESLNGRRLLADVRAQRETGDVKQSLVVDGDGEPLFPQLLSHPLEPLPGASRELAIMKRGRKRFEVDGENIRAIWLSEDRETIHSLHEGGRTLESVAGHTMSRSIENGQNPKQLPFFYDGRLLDISNNGKLLAAQENKELAIHQLFSSVGTISTIAVTRISHALFSPDDSKIALFDRSQIHIHETRSGAQICSLSRAESHPMAFSSDGSQIAYVSRRSVKVADIKLGTNIATLSRDQVPSAIAFLPSRNDRLLLGGSNGNGAIDLWDLSESKKLSSFLSHSNDEDASVNGVNSIQCHPNGESVVSSSSDGRVCWWELDGQRLLASFHDAGMVHQPIGQDGKSYLIGKGRFDLPELVPSKVDKPRRMPRVLEEAVLYCEEPAFEIEDASPDQFGFSQDGRLIVSVQSSSETVPQAARFYELQTGHELAPMTFASDASSFHSPQSNQSLPWRPAIDSAEWYSLFRLRSLVLSDPARAAVVRDLCKSPFSKAVQYFSPDGTVLASSGSKPLAFYDTKNGNELVKLRSSVYGSVNDCIIAPNNQSVAVMQNRLGSVWDLKTGERRIQPFSRTGKFLEYSQDGRFLAGIDDNGLLKFWSTGDWTEAASFEPPSVRQDWAGFNPSATHFATIVHAANGREVKIWNIATKALESTIAARNVVTVRFVHDDRLWVWENAQRKIEDRIALYSMTGQELARIQNAGDEVTKVRFSPSGRHIATLNQLNKLFIWDIYNSR